MRVEGSCDLNRHLSVGAKVGGQFAESAADNPSARTSHDARFATLNACYHLSHKWGFLGKARRFEAKDADLRETMP